ncbi:LSU ribosomal protein L29E, partial [Giardia duodenalis]
VPLSSTIDLHAALFLAAGKGLGCDLLVCSIYHCAMLLRRGGRHGSPSMVMS